MFEFKYRIELKNSEIVKLFGEDYYSDKSIFWNSHQTTLNKLYKSVIETGFPLKITDLENDHSLIIQSKNEFHEWLSLKQPFKVDD